MFLSQGLFLEKKNNFLWPGDDYKLLAIIKSLPFCESNEQLVGFISFWNNYFLLADRETLFFEKLKKIN